MNMKRQDEGMGKEMGAVLANMLDLSTEIIVSVIDILNYY